VLLVQVGYLQDPTAVVSALGQKRAYAVQKGMSALSLKAGISQFTRLLVR